MIEQDGDLESETQAQEVSHQKSPIASVAPRIFIVADGLKPASSAVRDHTWVFKRFCEPCLQGRKVCHACSHPCNTWKNIGAGIIPGFSFVDLPAPP